MIKTTTILMLLSLVFQVHAQNKLDSLEKLANRLMMSDREAFYGVSDQIIHYSKEQKNDSLLVESYMTRAMVHFLSREYEEALAYYDSIQNIAPEDSREYMEARIGTADIYPKLNYPDSFVYAYHQNIIQSIIQGNDSSLIASEYSNFGNYLVDEVKYYEGIQNLIKSLDYTPQSQQYRRMMNMVKLAKLFLYLEDYEKANYYGEQAHQIANKHRYKLNHKLLALLRGRIALHKQDYRLADSLMQMALVQYKKEAALKDVFTCYVHLSNVALSQNKTQLCSAHLDSARTYSPHALNDYIRGKFFLIQARNNLLKLDYELAERSLDSLQKYLHQSQNIYLKEEYWWTMAELAKKRKDYKNSLTYFERYHETRDSLFAFKTKGKIYDLESQFQHEEKEKEIELLTTKNELISVKLRHETWEKIAMGIVTFISLLFLVFLGITYYKVKAKNQLIRKTAAQKDFLLKEIHHRVKNNLQLISSLLNLQSRYIKDETARQVSMEGKTRVRAMSLIHQSLYQKDDLINLSIDDYFKKLVKELFDIYHVSNDDVSVSYQMEDLNLDVDRIIPLGLIFNELMTNILKYAFPAGNQGKVEVKLEKTSTDLILEVADNGIGMKENQINERKDSFGFTLIEALLSKWKGKLIIQSQNGTQVRIVIPNKQ
jgi:two-component sensor histidine kinase/tetratricopeptide (TPR) repeat protein